MNKKQAKEIDIIVSEFFLETQRLAKRLVNKIYEMEETSKGILRTKEEIKRKIVSLQMGKHNAEIRGDDASYKAWVKAEKWLKWVVE